MEIDRIRLAGLTAVVLATLVFFMLILRYEFPAFDYADLSAELVEIEIARIGLEVSRFLWTYRLLDLIAQAFVLFAAAACCGAVLRAEEEKQ